MEVERFSVHNLEGASDFFRENGFAVISGVYSSQILEDFDTELRSLVRAHLHDSGSDEAVADPDLLDRGVETLERCDHSLVASLYDSIAASPAFLRIVAHPTTEKLVRMFLGKDSAPLYGFTNRCLIAPPFDERRTYGWHQEVFYTIPRSNFIQTWAPLVSDSTIENGTIEVAPGSHLNGILPQDWIETEERARQMLVKKSTIDVFPQVSVEMSLGELLLFSGFLAHRSGVNSSSSHRYSLVGMYHDVSKPGFRAPAPALNFRGERPEDYFRSIFPDGSKAGMLEVG